MCQFLNTKTLQRKQNLTISEFLHNFDTSEYGKKYLGYEIRYNFSFIFGNISALFKEL